jgi:hypothetical protein
MPPRRPLGKCEKRGQSRGEDGRRDRQNGIGEHSSRPITRSECEGIHVAKPESDDLQAGQTWGTSLCWTLPYRNSQLFLVSRRHFRWDWQLGWGRSVGTTTTLTQKLRIQPHPRASKGRKWGRLGLVIKLHETAPTTINSDRKGRIIPQRKSLRPSTAPKHRIKTAIHSILTGHSPRITKILQSFLTDNFFSQCASRLPSVLRPRTKEHSQQSPFQGEVQLPRPAASPLTN